jgi:hypothetical protein
MEGSNHGLIEGNILSLSQALNLGLPKCEAGNHFDVML